MKGYSTNLASLLAGVGQVPAALDTRVHGLTLDSREVTPGDLFLAVSGSHSSALAHIEEAVERGAVAVVIEGQRSNGRVFEDGGTVELYVENLRDYLGLIADRFYRAPSKELSVVGVTGTNGKTSVTHYIAQFLKTVNKSCGVIGTLGYGMPYAESSWMRELLHTTPDVVSVHRYLAELRDAGARYVAMEVSSHGLVQGRVAGVRFTGAVFTNLSRDHLDYHQSMEAYAAAKQQLFRNEHLVFAVLNNDDSAAQLMKEACAEQVEGCHFGVNSEADISVTDVSYALGIKAHVNTPAGRFLLQSSLPGDFNLSNLLAVVGVGLALGCPLDALHKLDRVRAVGGRMESIQVERGPRIIVDYAHTPDALLNVLRALRPQCQGKLNLVFGCGGDRDRGKRALMGQVAVAHADDVIVCDDNPRTEAPEQITTDILSGLSESDVVEVIHDRAVAIERMLRQSGADDFVLIAGKGHETYQEINGIRRDFNDLDVARTAWSAIQKTMGEEMS